MTEPSMICQTPAHLLSMLGLARRAGFLIVGQDDLRAKLREQMALLVIAASDCAPNVLRHVQGVRCIVLEDVDREDLGTSIGLPGAQIVALPAGCGFAKKISNLLSCENEIKEEIKKERCP